MAAKKTEEKTAEQIKEFRVIIWKIQEVENALNTQAALIELMRDILRDTPESSEVTQTLKVMAEATINMMSKLGDAENYLGTLCREITGEQILYSVLLDDLKMYSKPGGLHD